MFGFESYWSIPIARFRRRPLMVVVTIEKARRILGKKAESLGDDQILAMIKIVKSFADVCAESISNRINTEGTEFLYKERQR